MTVGKYLSVVKTDTCAICMLAWFITFVGLLKSFLTYTDHQVTTHMRKIEVIHVIYVTSKICWLNNLLSYYTYYISLQAIYNIKHFKYIDRTECTVLYLLIYLCTKMRGGLDDFWDTLFVQICTLKLEYSGTWRRLPTVPLEKEHTVRLWPGCPHTSSDNGRPLTWLQIIWPVFSATSRSCWGRELFMNFS